MNHFDGPPENFSLDPLAHEAKNAPMPFSTAPVQRLSASDGVPIAYCVHEGDSSVPCVALVHSLAMDHRFWDPVIDHLANQATVITIDARGHGSSGRGMTQTTVQRMAEDLREVLEHLQVPRAVIGGASMGGCVALQFAGMNPDRTSGLALIDTTAWYGPTAEKDWEERATKAAISGLSSMVEFQQTRWFSDAFRASEPGVVQACIDTFLANDLDAYVATCRMLGAFDGRELLARIQVPTHVLVGEEDYAAPVAMAQAMHEAIVGSRLTIFGGARHLTPLEVPEKVAASLLELFAEARS